MKLHIHKLIIWPEDIKNDPRVLSFEPSKVSVVTGWSSTGKSALIAIVDYVLGSDTCAIPIERIRDAASWYGLEIETASGLARIARRKPDGRHVSNDYWLQLGADLENGIPKRPSRTAGIAQFLSMMDLLSGLTGLQTNPENEGGGFEGRASFRDMAAFNFLPQHIVANPYTMFFKTDSSVHREKLRNVLPLALGTITNDELLRRHQLHLLRAEQRRVENELRARREGLESWRASATGAFYKAQELNLLPPGNVPGSLDAVLSALRLVVERNGEPVRLRTGRVAATVNRLEAIRLEEAAASAAIADGKRRLRRLKSLRTTVEDFGEVLAEQRARVRGVGWFREAFDIERCVLCGSTTDTSKHALAQLDAPIRELEELSLGRSSAEPIVDGEIVAVQRQLAIDERRLAELQLTRRELESLEERERGEQFTLEGIYRFIGSIENALAAITSIEGEGGFVSQLETINRRINALTGQGDEAARTQREQLVRRNISSYISRFIEAMGVPGTSGTPYLDERELNLRFEHGSGMKADLLWEVGSGQNWMAYHLATLLALHGVFLKRSAGNTVPTFLIVDQPSQVYFPSDSFDQRTKEGTRYQDDLARTRSIYESLARATRAFEGELQLIVLDHADKHAWGDIGGIHEAANWRDGEALIPESW